MKVMVWIAEATWERCVEQARPLLAAEAQVTLVHVSAADVESVVGGARTGLLGRRATPAAVAAVQRSADEEARGLLAAARDQLGRPADLRALRGRVEREVVAASAEFELLVLARDGTPQAGPKSLGKAGRFIVDHAACPVLLLPRERTEAPVLPPPPPTAPPAPPRQGAR